MSSVLGPLAFGKREEQIFLGREIASHQDYSEQTAQQIDSEVRRIVTEQHERAKRILTENVDTLRRLADSLLEYETLDGMEINTIIAGGVITREKPVKSPPPASSKPPVERKEKKKILDALEGLGKLGSEPTKA
jgi:cell division protease FtsH